MSTPPEAYYSEERWQNWIDRLRDEEIDPEDEDSARLLLNLQDDAAIAVAKIVNAAEDGHLEQEEALEELVDVRDIVLADVEVEDEETAFPIDGVQTSLVCVFLSAEQYLAEGPESDETVEALLAAAASAEAAEEFDRALDHAARAGTRVIDGDALDVASLDDLEYFVTEWVTGLDSLQGALSDPEVVEEDE
jgi:hypothetical protein